jgi:SAM-dependent methyltransferase
MFSLGKSNVCVDNFGQMLRQHAGVSVDSSGGARPLQRATGAWKQLRQQAKRRLDGRLSQTGLCTSDKTRRWILPKSLPIWCGGSLYRLLFGSCTYHQADLAGEPNLHFEHSAASLLPRELKDNDFVLSTQVLKHVENSANCLQECYRVLKPGVRLLLTTHGLFENRACPYDYWRWTEDGLEVKEIKKVTTGPHEAFFLVSVNLADCAFAQADSMDIAFLLELEPCSGFVRADDCFPHCRVVDANESGHDVYVVIAPLAAQHSD